MTKVESFINQFVALVKGDDASVIASKVWRQVDSSLKSQIPSLEGKLIRKEEAVEKAKECLRKALLNNGRELTIQEEDGLYCDNLIQAKESLKQAEKQLAAHKETISFLKEQHSLLKAE
jgi:hypothetical protein